MKTAGLKIAVVVLIVCGAAPALASVVTYGATTVSGGYSAGNFAEVWDLTKGDLTLSFRVDLTGMVDNSGAHAWAEFGVRQVGAGNFNPNSQGVWLSTDYDGTANTFDPDPDGYPTLDLDDKLILQRVSGQGEGAYDLPGTPPVSGNNHRFWFDRDGVDQWQDDSPLAVNGGTYNTGGVYNIVLTLHATGSTTGTAYMTINGLAQGFETDGNLNTMELSPAGLSFTGNMAGIQVFYGIFGYGATHSATFSNIRAEGVLVPVPPAFLLAGIGIGAVAVARRVRRRK